MSAQPPEKTAPSVEFQPQSKGERTRERILDLTFEAVIRKGFAATSIEELVEAAGLTKSGFFYHFRDKADLARQLIERYNAESNRAFDALMLRARELSDDPLHAFLVFLKLYAEAMAEVADAHPGCMVATVTFQDRAWDRSLRQTTLDSVAAWRGRLIDWLDEIAAAYPPKGKASAADLAEALLAFTYGGLTLTKALGDPTAISRQVLMFRETIRLHFLGA
ncbi:TetR/AcrR family transcriptional regulator [Caulobacter segnis]|uniref:Transcriptional regulator, TetR family n=1 Tax=Caulobacter segnis (strain ATCC 21756 / DSM 7131 / JCM 7823 / NBRC 15250 / LMG 17158 / TK0059) TaxID=509190 RepID=D5VMW4_CAUST|nr:TetR/AcrR family transcriptional regulator [Caulobacter segnis]ADG11837.1 transcriptional regulator, TetR family [Caulobacter segnis ATCC 21756]